MKVFRSLSMALLVLALGIGATSCNNVSDADVQSAAQQLLASNPELDNVLVTVENQVATLTGTVADDATKSYAESTVAGVENVKSVVNQIEVVPPAPDYTALDESINAALADLLKEYNKVTATVKDGVIQLKGEIKKSEQSGLLEKLNALNPIQIVDSTTVK
ncbi:MAG: BON domain-containing protein [Porphyromonadaceae bacterium]|nr:BON domain-containing protein [Porphyromonadaceae bacterium]